VVHVDEIAEAIWPDSDQRVVNTVRHFIHALREKIEPDRSKRAPSSFIVAEAGGYRLDRDRVKVDADKFEADVKGGLACLGRGEANSGVPKLVRAMALYSGDFLSDEPYAMWALSERDRLRDLAVSSLDALATEASRARQFDAAVDWLERLAQMQPLDSEVERKLIAIALQTGRHSVARRRYASFRMRVTRAFGHEPDFQLADIVREVARKESYPLQTRT
jgi:DNA-binding SARP family transcriptional activator